MTENGVIALAMAIVVGLATIGPGIGQGYAGGRALDAFARQPEKKSEIRGMLIFVLAFLEALTIYGLLIAFLLFSRMK